MTKKQIEKLQNLLNERYEIALMTDDPKSENFLPNNPNYIYYKAILDTIEIVGYYCIRKDNKHYIYKS